MISIEDIKAARKAIIKICEGETHYSFVLDEFIDKVETDVKAQAQHIPALLRRKSSESV